MSKRNITIIILICIAALIMFVSNRTDKDDLQKKDYLLKKINFNNIKSITIKNYVDKGFTLKKNDKGEWFIDNTDKICNKYRIEYLVNLLRDTEFNNIISDNKDKYSTFNVDEKNAIKVKIKTGKETINIWIGKFTPDGNGCYVRLANGNVYIVTKNLTFEFDKKRQYFYLKKNTGAK